MKKFILYIILVLGITQLNYSCVPESKIPFLANMRIVADSLLDAPFPDSLNFENRGLELTNEQYYALCSDSIENEKIVSIKKYKDNYLVFFCQKYGGWVDAVLYDKYGKRLDRCAFMGLASQNCRVSKKGRQTRYMEIDTIDINSSLWNIGCQGDDKIVLEGVFFKTDTLKMTYSISDKITKIGRTASKEIATPALDIKTFAISQVDSACERLSVYGPLPFKSGCVFWTMAALLGTDYLLPYIKYNPQGVLQWIYDHKNEKVEDCLYYCYEFHQRYSWGFSLDFLRENILKLKDKKAQEYLLNMRVFKENSELQEK